MSRVYLESSVCVGRIECVSFLGLGEGSTSGAGRGVRLPGAGNQACVGKRQMHATEAAGVSLQITTGLLALHGISEHGSERQVVEDHTESWGCGAGPPLPS